MPYVPETPDVENDHRKTIYAHFGLAAYLVGAILNACEEDRTLRLRSMAFQLVS